MVAQGSAGPPNGQGGVMTLFLVLAALLLTTAPTASPPFVPGEILVKFAPGTGGSAAVTQASRGSPPDLGTLAVVVDPLAAKTGVPLKAKQVTGGNWIVLSVDSDMLTDHVARQLRARENVAKVEVSRDRPEAHPGLSLPKKLVIKFSPGSAEAETVAQKLADPTDVGFAQLIRALEKYLGLPLKGDVTAEAKVIVQIDLKALTPILLDRIKTLPDIESAQPNYIETIR